MPQFLFLDKITNTTSLKVKLNNKYKSFNQDLLASSAHSLTIGPKYSSANSYSIYDSVNYEAFSATSTYFENQPPLIEIVASYNYYYFAKTSFLYVADSFEPQEEYNYISSISVQPSVSSQSQSDSFFNAKSFIVNSEVSSIPLSDHTVIKYASLSTDNKTLYSLHTQAPFSKAYKVSSFVLSSDPIYIQNKEDTLDLTLDIEANEILELYPVVASTYTPPDPTQNTIITLKEFWA